MTVKNLPQRSSQSVSLNISRSDMQKRGAVRNLFNATVDREELQMQINQLERESNRQLKSYKVNSIIGVIDEAREDQGRKRLQSCLDSSDDDSDDQPQRTATTDRQLPESSSDNSSPASPSSAAPSTSSKKSDPKGAQPRSLPLAKGQTTIKGNDCDSRCTKSAPRESETRRPPQRPFNSRLHFSPLFT